MSCSDILLTFLQDTHRASSWTDSFQFPEDNSLPDISDLLSCDGPLKATGTSMDFDFFFQQENNREEDFDSFADFCDALENCDDELFAQEDLSFLQNDSFTSLPTTAAGTHPFHKDIINLGLSKSVPNSTPKRNSKSKSHATLINAVADIGCLSDDGGSQSEHPRKRKATKQASDNEETFSPTKQQKVPAVVEKLGAVVALLKQMNKKRYEDSMKRESQTDPIGLAQGFLNIVMGSQLIQVNDMLALASPSVVFECPCLTSIFNRVHAMKADPRIPVWAKPVNATKFPDKHIGIGQTMAAARCFSSILPDLMSHTVSRKIQFFPRISVADTVVSARNDQLTSPFTWQTHGLISLGYSHEVEINGLIRCSFCKEGISMATVSYDAFTLVRKLEDVKSALGGGV